LTTEIEALRAEPSTIHPSEAAWAAQQLHELARQAILLAWSLTTTAMPPE
jgi:hypothetical protein